MSPPELRMKGGKKGKCKMIKLIYALLEYIAKNQRTLEDIVRRLERIEKKVDDLAGNLERIENKIDADTLLLKKILELLESGPEPAVDLGLTAGPVEEQPS